MRDILGLVTVDQDLMVASAIIMIIGLALAVSKFAARRPLLAAVGYVILIVGVLAALQSIWINGFRELNLVLSIGAVILLGWIIAKNIPGTIAKIVGAVVIVLGVISLSATPLVRDVNFRYDDRVSAAFSRGWDRLTSILDLGDQRNNQPNRQRSGQNQR